MKKLPTKILVFLRHSRRDRAAVIPEKQVQSNVADVFTGTHNQRPRGSRSEAQDGGGGIGASTGNNAVRCGEGCLAHSPAGKHASTHCARRIG